ncbi:MAG: hypothetical protein M0Z94_11255 [Dehalococcoidales bacterium]|nr:hypothetical protein [Dehalococcoidales bacterium]
MTRYLWYGRLLIASLASAGCLAWLVSNTDPGDNLARMAFVILLTVGAYAVVTPLVCLLIGRLWPAAPAEVRRLFAHFQGLLWSGLVMTGVLLRLSGELTAATALISLVVFACVQCLYVGRSG